MRKTFEELLETEYHHTKDGSKVVDLDNCIELMKLVRQKTLIEASDYADADYNIIDTSERAGLFREDNIKVYVLKESILQLDKDSIEI